MEVFFFYKNLKCPSKTTEEPDTLANFFEQVSPLVVNFLAPMAPVKKQRYFIFPSSGF